jgi:hypothetical protein
MMIKRRSERNDEAGGPRTYLGMALGQRTAAVR